MLVAFAIAATSCSSSSPDVDPSNSAGGGAPTEPAEVLGSVESSSEDPAPSRSGPTTKVGAEGGFVELGGVTVEIPKGASVSTVEVERAEVAWVSQDELLGQPVHVEAGESPLSEPVIIRWDIADLSDFQRALIDVVRWYPDEQAWGVVDAGEEMDIQIVGDELVVSATRFSFISWTTVANVGQTFGELLGKRTDAPSCEGGPPSWVRSYVRPDEDVNATPVRTCFGNSGADALQIGVANNRTVTQVVTIEDGWRIARREFDREPGVDELIYEAARLGFDNDRRFLLPPGKTNFLIFEQSDNSGFEVTSLQADVDGATLAVDLLAAVAEEIAGALDQQYLSGYVSVLYECVLGTTTGNVYGSALIASVVQGIGSCAAELTDPTSRFGLQLNLFVLGMSASDPRYKQSYRKMQKLSKAFKFISLFNNGMKVADYTQLKILGSSAFSFSATGRPPILGQWSPTCFDSAEDSRLFSRNLLLQPEYEDKTRELHEFASYRPNARIAARPLSECSIGHLTVLLGYIEQAWDDNEARDIMSSVILSLIGESEGPKDLSSLIGKVVRFPDRTSGFVDAAEVWNPIPDGGTYLCLVSWNGAEVVTVSEDLADQFVIGSDAKCVVNSAFDKVLRASDNTSIYVDAGGIGHAILDGGTYNCLVGWKGKSVLGTLTNEGPESNVFTNRSPGSGYSEGEL